MTWKVVLTRNAEKELDQVGDKERRILIRELEALEKNPRSGDTKKLAGLNAYRRRKGKFRIVFTTDAERIIIHKIEQRNDNTYKNPVN